MLESRRFVKQTIISGLVQFTLVARGLIILPIIAKTLGAAGYGIWAQAMITLALAEFLYLLGLHNSMTRFLAVKTDTAEIREGFFTILSTVFAGSLVVAALIAVFSGQISQAFIDGQAETVVKLVALVIPFSGAARICAQYFLTFRRIRGFVVMNVARYVGEVAIIGGLVLSGYGVNGAMIAVAVTAAITSIGGVIVIGSQIGFGLPRFRNLKSYLKFGLPIVPLLLFVWIATSSNRYVITHFHGITWVGIYAVGYSLAQSLNFIQRPLVLILQPTLSKAFDEKRFDDIRHYISNALKYALMISIPAAAGLSMLSQPLLLVLSTAEIATKGYLVIPIIATNAVVSVVYGVGGAQVLMLVKKTHYLAAIWGGAAALNLGLNFAFVPSFGILAAAASTLSATVLATAITLFIARRNFPFTVHWGDLVKTIIATGVMSVCVYFIAPAGVPMLMLTIVVAIVIYVLLLRALKAISREEIKFLRQLLARRRGPGIGDS